MTNESIDAKLDQIEAHVREFANALLKIKPDLEDASLSQKMRMMTIIVKFGEMLGQKMDAGDLADMMERHSKNDDLE